MATITGSVAGGNWNTVGAWVGGVIPLSGDDVLLTATSGNITIPTATTVACRSLDCTGYIGVFTFASTTAKLDVGDASGGALKFVAGMTLTLTGSGGTITMKATTASTTYALTTGGKTLPNVVVAAGASTTIQLADDMTLVAAAFGELGSISGIVDLNGKTVALQTVNFSGASAKTLTMGAATITAAGAGVAWAVSGAIPTVTANTATVTLSGSAQTFAGGGVNYNGMTLAMTGSGVAAITSANTFGALTRTGTAAISDALQLSSNQTVTGALTLTGNAAANRLWVQSNTPGTPRTITCNGTVTATRADFEDIVGAGSASWNLAAATGGSGDCGGNSGITFTTPISATGILAGNFSATATWSSGLVPLPQDTVVLDASAPAGTYTMDMARHPAINAAGFTRTLSLASSATQRYIHGSLTLAAGMTFSVTGNLTFAGRGSHTLTSATKAFTSASSRSITIGRFGGTYTLADDANFGISPAGNGLITAGGVTFTAAGFNVTAYVFTHGSATINMGAGTWTAATTAAPSAWVAVAGTTVNASTSTIALTGVSATTHTFDGGSKTYGTLTYTVAGSTGQLSITGSNTFANINFSDASNARTLAFTAATTTTITGAFNVVGTATKLMTIGSATAANHTLTMTSGVVSIDYTSISRSQAGGGAAWWAGINSTNGGNNAGWIFASPGPALPHPRPQIGVVPATYRAANW